MHVNEFVLNVVIKMKLLVSQKAILCIQKNCFPYLFPLTGIMAL